MINLYENILKKYEKITDLCYEKGITVDEYIQASVKSDGSLKNHIEKIYEEIENPCPISKLRGIIHLNNKEKEFDENWKTINTTIRNTS